MSSTPNFKSKVPIVITDSQICITLRGNMYTMNSTDPDWDRLKESALKEDWANIYILLKIPKNRWTGIEI